MAKYSFNKEEFEAWKRAQQESAELQQKLNSSLKDYLATVRQIGELQKNIQYVEKTIGKLVQEKADLEAQRKENTLEMLRLRRAGVSASSSEITALLNQNKELKKQIFLKAKSVDITEHQLELLKKETDELAKQVKETNKLALGFNSITKSLAATPGLISKGYGKLKGTGIFEMDKEIRNATRSMAGGQKTYDTMFKSLTKASDSTTMWGVGLKDLAIMQQNYSEAIGRSVMLTEKGAFAMAGIAEGTGLGKEFASQLAGSMDNFNVSVERTGQIVEDNMNMAAKMGVNGSAAMKAMQNNLKLAQKYNFKGGINGLSKFSVEATKLKLDLEGISGMVEKVFRPEGAIEMAAELATMGGNFAALGDPMQLMFKARNDFGAFSKDIGKASAEFVTMNKETGEFSSNSGLAKDRMREISRITGIAVDELHNMAEAEAKMQEIRKRGNPFISEEDMELVSSFAKFSEKDKDFVIAIDGKDKLVKDLREVDLEKIRADKLTLEERAEASRTFDDTITDFILTLKQQLVAFAPILKENIGVPIQKLVKQWKDEGFFDSLKGFIKGAAEFGASIGKWLVDTAIWLGPKGTLATIFGAQIAFNIAKWVANGMALGRGFNMVASVGGGMSGVGKYGVPGGSVGPALPMSGMQKALGGNVMGGRFAAGTMGSLGLGLGLGVLGTGLEYGRSQMDDPDSTGGKLLGIGGKAAKYAGYGAMLGPWGALIGGALGAGVGVYDEYIRDDVSSQAYQGGSSGFVRANDGIMFHPNDKFMQVNDGVTIAGTSTSGNNKLAQELKGNNTSGEINHSFKDLNIKISVDAPTDSEFWRSVVNQPDIMRRITEAVYISTEEAASGKISGKTKRRM
jgi:hypothetical protein